MPTDLELAFKTLQAKQKHYDKLFEYYDGDQSLVYSTRRLERAFNKLETKFVQNWMAVVVDAANAKINLKRLAVLNNNALSERLNSIFESTELVLDAHDAHLAALVTGEAFVIAWPDEQGQICAYYNDPRVAHVFYDENNPRQKRFAAKWWCDGEGKRRITLYYPDRLEYYISTGKAEAVRAAGAFIPLEGEPNADNPYGVIPVFHLRRERRKIRGEFEGVLSLQDAVNKLLADMMVVGEYGAFPQRWMISQAGAGTLKNAPNEIWDLPAGDGEGQGTSVGQFEPADLNVYLVSMDKLASSIGIITRTPKHYFFAQSGDPSGEALIAMEAPLNDKVTDYIARFKPVWTRIGAFLLQLDGQTINPEDIQPVFSDPRTIQPLTQAQIRQTNVNAGYPLRSQLRDEGKSNAEIEQIEKDRQEERAGQQQTLAAAVLNARRQLDGGQQSNGLEQPVAAEEEE